MGQKDTTFGRPKLAPSLNATPGSFHSYLWLRTTLVLVLRDFSPPPPPSPLLNTTSLLPFEEATDIVLVQA